ncbi:MAG TPA: ATP-binding protein [Sphingobium sp.]
MSSVGHYDSSWAGLIDASERLATSRSLDAIIEVLRDTARDVAGAEGIAVVIREADKCFYAAEDSAGPLWQGNRFPLDSCISGWAMMKRETVLIRDTRIDPRIPQEAYAPTFVRSLVMAPIGRPDPVAAIGAYWSDVRDHDPAVVRRLEALARAAAIAIENAKLLTSLQESDRQRSIALEAGRMGLWTLDLASQTLETSTECRIIFGRNPAEDFPYQALREAIHPDDQARIYAAIEESVTAGRDYDVEYRIVTPAQDIRWVSIRAQPVVHANGTIVALSGVSADITERKNMEQEREMFAATLERRVHERTRELVQTQDALRQSQKLEAMGQLTGGVAHDFNNLLTPILGSLDLLTRRKTGDEREQRLIAGALQSAERARTLVQRLLAFARRQPLKPTAVDVSALLWGMSPLIGTTLGPLVELVLDMDADLPMAQADHNQLEMALLNIAVNAHDAMPVGGKVVISAHAKDSGHDAALDAGRYVVITMADNGKGMDAATRERAIEPFFSTKGIGKGTGLGLSMVHGLVAQLGGKLTIVSDVGVGTGVEIWLPVSNVQTLIVPVSDTQNITTLPAGTVLLVDDEPLVRASTADMLSELGMTVIEAASGKEALGVLAGEAQVDMIVTDHMMPMMTGAELAATVRKKRPDLPILLVSGYSDLAGIPSDVPRLEKPFRQVDLANSVSSMLSHSSAA